MPIDESGTNRNNQTPADPHHGRHAGERTGPELVPLPGSHREPAPRALRLPDARQSELYGQEITVTVVLRRAEPVPGDALSAAFAGVGGRTEHGASTADIELATSTLTALGAVVSETDAASRRLRVSGTVELLCTIFGTQLERVSSLGPDHTTTTHRHRTGGLSVPAELDSVITAVLGLDDRPSARAPFYVAHAGAENTSYTPLELGAIYGFPAAEGGKGQGLAIIELGGGFEQADLDAYFTSLGITGPVVTAVGIDGAVNVPGGDPQGADGEVLLDIEVAGSLAPAAAMAVYFAPNTDAGFLDAIAAATHASPPPAAMSISWGQSEDQWTEQARTAMDDAFIDAAMLGITVTVAAGDNGSADAEQDGRNHVDFPASSPHVLACGGTRLEADPATGVVSSETVWNDSASSATGGGVSDVFALPAWQQHVLVKAGSTAPALPRGRGVPDVAAVADPQTGYRVRVDGADLVFGGTSAVAPLWAALVVLLCGERASGFGLLQPVLYPNAPDAPAVGLRDITVGDNGSYKAAPGWDACTGLGVPDGVALQRLLAPGTAAAS
ncbi:S53 family peptidase [Paeniglutamicibacter cryotolerans]|uniref:Kumamolisin n=1 Tax=Paeniglutamicibacter cryotolerans TaxID=670079 RepID=A0A839QGQ4_9MICC|nr:S53 family peptidase [Paeniglutamicibacter cryotolerans]MBB2994887.1 kumamolisin [Paeniglutamicibacter cryotolerans]